MKVLLISANTERINMVSLPLGLGLVAAATRRAGHDVAFVDLLATSDPHDAIRRAVAEHQPDVIGISVRNIDDQNRDAPRFLLEAVRDVVVDCRSATAAPIVLGGAGYSIFAAQALAYLGADYGIAGDGEHAFPELLHRLTRGEPVARIPGLHVRSGPSSTAAVAHDLDSFPLWNDALAQSADPNDPDLWVPVQSRRGCPNDCSYCSTASIQGRVIRARSPVRIVEQVGGLAAMGYRRFFFVDNSFNIPERHARELCCRLAELEPHVMWRCILYPHMVSEELVGAMSAAGCVEVSLGFESGSVQILREMNKRYSPEDVRAVCGLLKAHGIRRMGFLLLGGPGETRDSVEESLAFAASLELDGLRVTTGIRIYPGTPLARRAVADGIIASEAELLRPRFYLVPELEGWIQGRIGGVSR
jgi:radical SAM superfamily enzyme YgiQ (UPF0313 family)